MPSQDLLHRRHPQRNLQVTLRAFDVDTNSALGSVLSNIAQALLRMRHDHLAIAYANAAVRVQPAPSAKSLQRAALAAARLDQFQAALYFLHQVCNTVLHRRTASVGVNCWSCLLPYTPSMCSMSWNMSGTGGIHMT